MSAVLAGVAARSLGILHDASTMLIERALPSISSAKDVQSQMLRVQAAYYTYITAASPEGMVIPPFLTGLFSRIHAAIFIFCAGVMPPMPILGRSFVVVGP